MPVKHELVPLIATLQNGPSAEAPLAGAT